MMYLNTSPPTPATEPNPQELAELQATLLPPALVMLVPEDQLERRCYEINITHPHYREETPVVLKEERQRRQRLSGSLQVVHRQEQMA
ncbi:hypothetical protein Q5H93_14855 [Hymenobacter sp. ASUV-10]|uniref:Uncharacterized protein n=1 Tax=Hymenobacter aranciens TaxID=3063996 RepID=A0ABT9BCN2_9BACT|nr:hypothetical protein [Hymenobacter sp. ASUV-10]MDO7876021.1 hypothetical protein [Hymenobacter sp. ASUV-10]